VGQPDNATNNGDGPRSPGGSPKDPSMVNAVLALAFEDGDNSITAPVERFSV
jgi:hypothetical protein